MGKYELVQAPHDNLLQYQKAAKSIFKNSYKVAPLQPFKARINTFTAHVQLDTRHKGPSLACEHRFPCGLYVLSHS